MTTVDPMIELCTLMLKGQLTSGDFEQWVTRHYGDPRTLEPQQVDAIVKEFDRCLQTHSSADGQFEMPERN